MEQSSLSAQETERKVIEMLRCIRPEGRIMLTWQANEDMHYRLSQFLLNLFPEASAEERKFLYIQGRYGAELAERMRRWIAAHDQDSETVKNWRRRLADFEPQACR